MNKYAAEKIASEYYNLGVQLALQGPGLSKTAGLGPIKLRNDVSTPLAALAAMFTGAGAGAVGGAKGLASTPIFSKGLGAIDDTVNQLGALKALHASPEQLAHLEALRDLALGGGGLSLAGAGALGALGGGAIGLKGAKKLLNRHNPIERYLDLGVAQIPLGKARI